MIKNGQKADETSFNAAFVSRTVDTSTTGKVTLANNADANSGATVTNTQRAINETFDAVGITGEGDATRKAYSSNNYVAQGDSHKAAIGKLDAQALAQTTAPVQATQVQGQLSIPQGGTGQSTKAAAFDALTPATTEGDLNVRGAVNTVRLSVGTTGQVLTTDTTIAGKVKWADPAASNVSNANGTLPIANGGTGQTSKATAFDALTPSTTEGDLNTRGATASTRLPIGTSGQVLTTDTTVAGKIKWATPTNQSLSSPTGTLPISNGGTGQTTKALSFDALSPTTTTGDLIINTSGSNTRLPVGTNAQVLTADSTASGGVKWATVSAANPNVSNATGILPIANGGTGQTTASAAFDALSPTTTNGDLIVRGASTNQRLGIGSTNQVLTSTASGLAWVQPSATTLSGAVPIANGGTGQTTKTTAFDALSPLTTKGDLQAFNGTNNVRVAVGANGQVLQSDSTNAAGVSWIAVSSTSVNATYVLNSNLAVTAGTAIKYSSQLKDTHAFFSTTTGLATIPIAGQYRISIVGTVLNAANSTNYYLRRTSGTASSLGYFCGGSGVVSGSISVTLAASDVVGIFIDVNSTLAGLQGQGPVNQVTFERTGN